MPWQRSFLIVALLLLALIAWLGRYTLEAPSSGMGLMYRLDRWTGEVSWMSYDKAGVVTYAEEN